MASITTFFGAQGGGGSVSGAPGQVCFFDSSSSAVGSDLLYWDAFSDRLSVGDPTTVPSTVTIAGAGASDATSSLEVRTDGTYGDLLLFRVYNNGRIDSRMLSSTEALTDNVAIGLGAGSAITTGDSNVLYGLNAGEAITSGSNNTAIGPNVGRSIIGGGNNTLVGRTAGDNINSGSDNIAIGREAGNGTTSGSLNISVGFQAGKERQTGTPGSRNTASTSSIYIGNETKAFSATDTNSIVIGNGALSGGSNTTVIGNSSTTNAYINGNINIFGGKNIVLDDGTGTQIGTTTTQKLAFYGDTPIVQPTTAVASATAVHGSGTAVKEDSTFGGYTIGQIVTALQTLGLLA